ncbi:MAG: Ig-like domain-containing protein [Leptospirales bacterium]|nr:Ig-like domain-containing protein [Leptospirales bacterium]
MPAADGCAQGNHKQLSPGLTIFGAPSDTSFSYSSSNPSVVTVSSSGVLSGLSTFT